MAAAGTTEERVIWKHIGLHGHAVGTFACDEKGIQWKSAVTGGRDDDDAATSTTKFVPAKALQGAQWTVFGRSGHLRLQTVGGSSLKHEMRFDGFPPQDVELLKTTLKSKYNVDLQKYNMSSSGTSFGRTEITNKCLVFKHCILEDADEEGQEFEPRAGDEFLSMDLTEVSQCVLPGNNRNEIELQFPESDTVEAGTDQLVAIRFYIPPDPDADPNDRTVDSNAELMQQRIMQAAKIKNTAGNVIVEFDQNKGTFLTPRGRYAMELTESFLRMRGQKYDYKIRYDDISRLFLLPRPDDVHMAFVIALDKPIRQGQQRYQYLTLQTTKEPDEVTVNLDEEALKNDYNGELQPIMQGALSNLIAKTFKVIAGKKVFIPGKFANATQHACVRCALRANEGLLYPLEKQFLFIHKPTVLVRFDEVESVEFQRYAGGQGSTRNFDLCVTLKASAVLGANTKEYVFSGIERSDYASLYSFLSGKKIRIKNLQEDVGEVEETARKAPTYNEDEIYGGPDEEMAEESEDESYDDDKQKKENEEEDESEDDMDSDDFGSEIDEKLDSDLEDARGGEKPAASKKEPKKDKPIAKKRPPPKPDDDDDDNDDDDDESPKKKAKKKKKDPNAPKKAMSSYMLFSNAIRSTVAAENPDASFGEIARLISGKFKELSEEERREWDEKAAADKKRYKTEMEGYDAPSDDDNDGGNNDSKKKKKDPDAPKKALSAWMYYLSKNRAQIKEANPDASFGDVTKIVAADFKKLSSEEKAKYEAMASGDKERYQREMKGYTPAPAAKRAAPAKKGAGDGKKESKKKKDPNEPKRPLSSYMLFANAMRSKVKAENPGKAFGELAKILGERFKSISAAEKEKYEKMAKADKERYKKEMAAYKRGDKKAEKESDSDGVNEEQDDDDDDDGDD